MTLSCNYEIENANITISDIYQAFENQERKIVQNTKEINVMKDIVKHLAKQLAYISEEKADIKLNRINKEFKQQELLPTSFQLENSANRSQSVKTVPQTLQDLSNEEESITLPTIRKTIDNLTKFSSEENGNDIPAEFPDCETQPLPSTYCHQYQILWYYSSKEGRCNRFRKGCEKTFRNS